MPLTGSFHITNGYKAYRHNRQRSGIAYFGVEDGCGNKVESSSCVGRGIETAGSNVACRGTLLQVPGYVLIRSKSETAELASTTDTQGFGRRRNLDGKRRHLDKGG